MGTLGKRFKAFVHDGPFFLFFATVGLGLFLSFLPFEGSLTRRGSGRGFGRGLGSLLLLVPIGGCSLGTIRAAIIKVSLGIWRRLLLLLLWRGLARTREHARNAVCHGRSGSFGGWRWHGKGIPTHGGQIHVRESTGYLSITISRVARNLGICGGGDSGRYRRSRLWSHVH